MEMKTRETDNSYGLKILKRKITNDMQVFYFVPRKQRTFSVPIRVQVWCSFNLVNAFQLTHRKPKGILPTAPILS